MEQTPYATKNGKLGIIRKDVQPGDIVCILYGRSVPVILRRYERSLEEMIQELKAEEVEERENLERMAIRMQRRWREVLSRRDNRPESINQIEKQYTASSINTERSDVGTNRIEPPLKPTPAEMPEDVPNQNARKQSYKGRAKALINSCAAGCYQYEFLGECYVHGLMEGEAFRHQNEKIIKPCIFELR